MLKGFVVGPNWILHMRLQQNGAICHTANKTVYLLKEKFCESINSRNEPVNYPPCTCAPLIIFLWDYVSSLYVNKPSILHNLQPNIEHIIAVIRPNLCEKVMPNWV